jgi:hypothetical protein
MLESLGLVTRVTKFAPPLSRQTTKNRRELLLPLLPPDGPLPPIGCDGCAHSEMVAPLSDIGEDPSAEGTGQSIRSLAEEQIIFTTEVAGFERTSTLSLLGRLVLQRIRPRVRSRKREEQVSACDQPQGGCRSASMWAAHSPQTESAVLPPEETVLPAIESRFTQLARRCLPGGSNKETR